MFTRRTFLTLLSFLPIGARIASAGVKRDGAILLTTRVAGYRFYSGSAVEGRLRIGDRLILSREPANLHDPRAVAVECRSGQRLGYLPRRCNDVPTRLMDQGVRVVAEIVAIEPGPAPSWLRLTIAVRLASV